MVVIINIILMANDSGIVLKEKASPAILNKSTTKQ